MNGSEKEDFCEEKKKINGYFFFKEMARRQEKNRKIDSVFPNTNKVCILYFKNKKVKKSKLIET